MKFLMYSLIILLRVIVMTGVFALTVLFYFFFHLSIDKKVWKCYNMNSTKKRMFISRILRP